MFPPLPPFSRCQSPVLQALSVQNRAQIVPHQFSHINHKQGRHFLILFVGIPMVRDSSLPFLLFTILLFPVSPDSHRQPTFPIPIFQRLLALPLFSSSSVSLTESVTSVSGVRPSPVSVDISESLAFLSWLNDTVFFLPGRL